MTKMKTIFGDPLFKGILQIVIAAALIGTFTTVWSFGQQQTKTNEILGNIQHNFDEFKQVTCNRLDNHDKDITNLKVNVGKIEALQTVK